MHFRVNTVFLTGTTYKEPLVSPHPSAFILPHIQQQLHSGLPVWYAHLCIYLFIIFNLVIVKDSV
jgi:hypothetical protein